MTTKNDKFLAQAILQLAAKATKVWNWDDGTTSVIEGIPLDLEAELKRIAEAD